MQDGTRKEYGIKLISDFFLTLLTQIAILGAGALNTLIFVRVLGAAGQGVMSFMDTTSTLITIFFGAGMQWTNRYFIGRDKGSASYIYSNSLTFAIFITLVLGIVYFFIKPWLSCRSLDKALFIFLYLSIPMTLLKNYNQSILEGFQNFRKYNLVILYSLFIYLALNIVLVVVFRLKIYGAALAWLSSLSCAFILSDYFTRKQIANLFFKVRLDKIADSFSVGIRALIVNAQRMLLGRLGIYFLTYLRGIESVGYYSIAIFFSECLLIVPQIVGQLIFPRAAAKELDIKEFSYKLNRLNILFSIPVSALIIAFGYFAFNYFFGPNFVISYFILLLLLPGIFMINCSSLLLHYVSGNDAYPFIVVRPLFLALVINLILNSLLVHLWGIKGAAVATSISYFCYSMLFIRSFYKADGGQPVKYLLPRLSDIKEIKEKIKSLLVKE